MNLKIRFAFLFTSFVSLILSVSAISIYLLYSNFRIEEFYSRLNKEAIRSYNLYEAGQINISSNSEIKKNNEYALIGLSLIIYDTLDHRVLTYPDTIKYTPTISILKKAQAENEYRYVNDSRECLILYIPETGHFVYASAFDKYGLRKLKNIQFILIGVLLGGIMLAISISFVFVKQVFMPLTKLSDQMLHTTELSNAEPVIVTSAKDEISQIAKSYNAMIERMKKAFDYQKSFVSHASHELRTPLAIMLSQTEAALNNQLSSTELKTVLQSLKEDQQDIIELTNSLLILSQYEKISATDNLEIVRIDDVIYECMEDIKKAFPDVIINFNFNDILAEEYLYIDANKSLLVSAIRNLIKNGYQYSLDKQISIELSANEDKIEVVFENNGEQVREDQQDKLFIPFFRADNIDKQKGHGLGLSIVQRIIQIHNGKIAYSALRNTKNSFTITLQKQKPVE
jgi:signal transduction histidine kinase